MSRLQKPFVDSEGTLIDGSPSTAISLVYFIVNYNSVTTSETAMCISHN